MDFKEATDLFAGRISHAEVAEALGVSLQSVRQARLDPSHPNYRRPPAGWAPRLARLVRERGTALQVLAQRIDRLR